MFNIDVSALALIIFSAIIGAMGYVIRRQLEHNRVLLTSENKINFLEMAVDSLERRLEDVEKEGNANVNRLAIIETEMKYQRDNIVEIKENVAYIRKHITKTI